MPRRLFLLPLAAAAAAGCFRAPPPDAPLVPTAPPPRVKLAVVVVFDQLRGDYLDRWRTLFGPDGFNRLMSDGAWFDNCHYPYATTTTGPGHASILSGCSADKHGIINNNWYDRKAGEEVYCSGSTRYSLVPPGPHPQDAGVSAEKPKSKPVVGNPDRMLSPTVADVLKQATAGKGKVIGLSLKDRGAILPTGKRPDGAYWFDDRFGTSTYYHDALPRWVADLNRSKLADQWFGKAWVRARADVNYDRFAGPDAGPGEGSGTKQGTVFPHPTTGGLTAPGPKYYEALEKTPYGNELLLAAAKAAVENEKLGADATPDLLVVSFSANDLIGHTWGPDSQEVLDVTLRSDALMADFLKYLDAKVGAGNYSVVVTADHGVCPAPEVAARKGLNARRVPAGPLIAGADKFLTEKFGPNPGKPADAKAAKPVWLEAAALPHLYLNYKLLKARKIDPAKAAAELAGWLRNQPEVYRAFTRAELLGTPPADDRIAVAAKKSYHPDRGGDVYVVGRPYWLFYSGAGSATASGTTHGSPHEYDTHVPLLAFGPGVGGGRRSEPVVPQQAAPITAAFLGVPVPRDCEYAPPATLSREP